MAYNLNGRQASNNCCSGHLINSHGLPVKQRRTIVNRLKFHSYAIYGLILVIITVSQADADVGSALLMRQSTAIGQLQDLKKRHTADALLKKAREALRENNLQLAEFYVGGAERLEIEYESLFAKFNDTPAKVREAIQQKRSELQRSGPQVSRAAVNTGNLPSDRFVARAAYEQTADNYSPSPQVPATLAGIDRETSIGGPVGKSDAIGYLKRGRQALASGNLVAAVGWYKSAAALGSEFGPDEYSPEALYADLVRAGVAPDKLVLSATSSEPVPPPGYQSGPAEPVNLSDSDVQLPSTLVDPQSVDGAAEDTVTSSSLLARAAKIHSNLPAKDNKLQAASQRVRQLLAQADAALNRGELELAEEYVLRAQEIQLPESAYEKGDRRPWMVLMEINRAHKRKYSVPSQVAAGEIFGPPPAQATYNSAIPSTQPNQLPPAQLASATLAVTGTGQPPQVSYGDDQPRRDNLPTAAVWNTATGPGPAGTQLPSPGIAAAANAEQIPQFQAYDLNSPGPFAGASIAPNQQLSAPSQTIMAPPQALSGTQQQSFAAANQGTPGGTSSFAVQGPSSQALNQQMAAPQFPSPPPAQIQLPAADPQQQARSAAVAQPFVAAPLLRTSPPAQRSVATPSPPAAVPGQVPGLHASRDDLPLQTVINPFHSPGTAIATDESSDEHQTTTITGNGKHSQPDVQLAAKPQSSRGPIEITEGDMDEPTPSIGDFGKLEGLIGDTSPRRPGAEPSDRQAENVGSPGEQLFAEGLQSLEAGRAEEALALFREAWAFESELDPDKRQKLQDYLQYLRRKVASRSSVTAKPDALSLDAEPSAESEVVGEASATEKARKIALQQLMRDLTAKRISVQALRQSNPKKAWDELNQAREQVATAKIDEEPRNQLLRRMDQEIAELEDYINQNRARIENDERNRQILAEIDRRREQKVQNQQKLAELVEEFNQLMEQQRYAEAVVTAKTVAKSTHKIQWFKT